MAESGGWVIARRPPGKVLDALRRPRHRTRVAAVLLLAALVVASCGESKSSAHPRPGVLLEVAVSDDDVNGTISEDALVLEGLSGSLTPAPEAVRAAACHNVEDWLDDITLDRNAVVGSSPKLLRVAELVARGEVDAQLALLVEYQWWHSSSALVVDERMREAGFDQSDLASYLTLVAQPPGDDSEKNFVVYAAASKMSEFVVIYAQVDQLSTGRTSDGAFPTVSTWIAGEDGLTDVSFPETDCKN